MQYKIYINNLKRKFSAEKEEKDPSPSSPACIININSLP